MVRLVTLSVIGCVWLLVSSAFAQRLENFRFELDSVKFTTLPDTSDVRLIDAELSILLRITNDSTQTYWYDSRPNTDAGSSLPLVNEFVMLPSQDANRWGSEFRVRFTEVGIIRRELKPGESTYIELNQRWLGDLGAPYLKFGVYLAEQEEQSVGVMWGPDIPNLGWDVLERLNYAQPMVTEPQLSAQMQLQPADYDKMLQTRAAARDLWDRVCTQVSPYGVTITDGVRSEEFSTSWLKLTSPAEIAQLLPIIDAFPEVESVQLEGGQLSSPQAIQECQKLIDRLPHIREFILSTGSKPAALEIVARSPKIAAVHISGEATDWEQPLNEDLAARLKTAHHVRVVSFSQTRVHPSVFRALTQSPQLELVHVGVVDDDAQVLAGLTINDFRAFADCPLRQIYVNFDSAGWTAADVVELQNLYQRVSNRVSLVEQLKQRLPARSEPPAPPENTLVVAEFNDVEYQEFEAERRRLATTVWAQPGVQLAPSTRDFPVVAVRHGGELTILPRQGVSAWDVKPEVLTSMTAALRYFPEIAGISVSSVVGPDEFPLEFFRQAAQLPDLRHFSAELNTAWPVAAIELTTEMTRLQELAGLGWHDEPESWQAFRKIGRLTELTSVGVNSHRPECLETLAELPNLRRLYLALGKEGSDREISEELRAAIAKFDGRLVTCGISGFGHPSFLRAWGSVKSLESFSFSGHCPGATAADFRDLVVSEALTDVRLDPLAVDEATQIEIKELELVVKRRQQQRTAREQRRKVSESMLLPIEASQGPIIDSTIDESTIDEIIAVMNQQGDNFNPSQLHAGGDEALRLVLQRVFPEAFNAEAPPADWFADRFQGAFRRYLMTVTELPSDVLLARTCAAAIRRGLHHSDRRPYLFDCLQTLQSSLDPEVHECFLPLADGDDWELMGFALERLNLGVVTPLHRRMLTSPDWRAKRQVLKLMPYWNDMGQDARELIVEIAAQLFAADATPEVTGTDDSERDLLAAIYWHLPVARAHLLRTAQGDDESRALIALQFLSDERYFRQPLDEELAAVVDGAMRSTSVDRRVAAARAGRIYWLTDAQREAWWQRIADSDDRVWQAAANALLQQQAWSRERPDDADVLERLRVEQQKAPTDDLRARYAQLLDVFTRQKAFPWVEWPL